jgi:hypothetical protein
MKKILICSFCHLVTWFPASPQPPQEYDKTVVFLNDNDSLLINLIHNKNSQLVEEKEIEIEETKGVYKLSLWHFAPSLNYDFINNNYYISLSTSSLVNHFLGKRQEKKKISAIERRHKAKQNAEEIKIRTKYGAILREIENIKLSKYILTNDILIYEIKLKQYQNNEIDSETFLREKSSILNKIKTHNTLIINTEKEILEIQNIAEYEFEINLKNFYFDIKNY